MGIEVGSAILIDGENVQRSVEDMTVSEFSHMTTPRLPLWWAGASSYHAPGGLQAQIPSPGGGRAPGRGNRFHQRKRDHEHRSSLSTQVLLLAAAAENAIKGVDDQQGPLAMLAMGDSLFLRNDCIESVENQVFAASGG